MTNLFRSAAAVAAALLFATASFAADIGVGPSFKGPVGLQLYSLRADFITKGVPAGLRKTKDLGFKYVELAGTYNLDPAKFKAMLDEHGFVPISGHFPFDKLRDDPEGVARDAKALGLKYAGCAWITHEGDFDLADAREAVRVFNKAGEVLAKENIKFFYHVHGYEYHKHGNGTLMDVLVNETKPEHVSFEMDVFWVKFPGQDPVEQLKKYGKRWELMHLKDMKKSLQTGSLAGKTDVTNDVALGTGQMDWPAILKEAQRVGVKWYFVEDEAPTVHDQIPQSLKYLESLKF